MASDLEITLKRYNGTDYDTLKPTTTWAQIEGKPATFTPTSHTHGDISNTGTITATAVTPANTDYILISDTSASGAIERGIQIGTGTTTFLRNDGTWATPADVDTNTYVSSASFNTGTGVLTLTKNDASIVTVDLDGKYAESSHTHSEYLKYNPDGDGIAIAYDDSNPTINGQAVGGGHVFGADGSSTNGYLNAKVLLANGITNSVSGYYVGAMTPSTGGTSTQVVDGSGNWVGNAIPAAKLGSHTHAISDVTNLQTTLDGKAATSHTHTISQISDRGNVGANLMATQNTTAATRFVKINPDHSVTLEDSTTFRTSVGAAATSHTHDDRYYTESETDTLLAGKAATSHTHTASQISDSGNVGRNLLTTSSATASTLFFKKNPDHTITIEDATTFRSSIGAAASSHTHTLANITDSGAAAAYGVIDSTTNAAIGTGTSLPTERDVYYGLVAVNGSSQSRATTIYAPTSAGSAYQTLRSSGSGAPVWVEPLEEVGSGAVAVNTYANIAFTSGMRNFYIEAQQDGTTGLYQIAKFYVTMENSYSLSTSSRYYRATWFNGSSALTITFQYYYSGTTFYIRHTGPTVTIGYRLYNLK